ncbi:unnamed protein product [Zymoseptoria tritici ST99CH_1A5]|uniref:RRM domain-containing protein n=2 Tax=Zymoseptoria tritici TaxID=1047171 RepID=A0A1X7RYP9_ZYMT9|nr:unnamed protein product [Zymoseptoria tritici ST99CH_3D7]SMY26029.1 unnamed protein product [Zymoseptoria tritici ST99CH_1A5]
MAANASAPGTEARLTPNQSLYIQNLPEKLQKSDLKRNLYMLFSTYGPVIDITALKTPKMRGQAHILFRDINSAQLAMRNLNNMEFFGREMRITYAKSRSQTIAKLTGTFVDPKLAAAKESAAATAAEKVASNTSALPPPPGSLPVPPSGLPPPPGLPTATNGGAENVPSPAAGIKRRREEDEDEEGDAAMEEDSGEEMEMSDGDD